MFNFFSKEMRITSLLAFIFLTSSSVTTVAQFTLTGKIMPSKDWESKLYLIRIDRLDLNAPMVVDSILLDKDGLFAYSFQYDRQGLLYELRLPPKGSGVNSTFSGTKDNYFFISAADKAIEIEAKADSLFYSARVLRGEVTKKITMFRDLHRPLQAISKIIEDSISSFPEKKQFFAEKYLPAVVQVFDSIRSKIVATLDTCASEPIILAGLFHLDRASFWQIEKKHLEKYSTNLTRNEVLLVQNIKKQKEEPEKNKTGLGLPNAPFYTNKSSKVNLNSFQGHFKVLDFWASWCGPCRQANRTYLPKLYEYLQQNNIPLIAITIDEDKLKWKEAIKKDLVTWPQVIEPQPLLKKLLGIQGVPHYVILDKNNTVVFDSNVPMLIERYIKNQLENK
jgi:thiol-disulfide isomerase/thioredoxin